MTQHWGHNPLVDEITWRDSADEVATKADSAISPHGFARPRPRRAPSSKTAVAVAD